MYERDSDDDIIKKLKVNFYDIILGTELQVESLYGEC